MNSWCMPFYPAKVSLKVISILFKVFWAYFVDPNALSICQKKIIFHQDKMKFIQGKTLSLVWKEFPKFFSLEAFFRFGNIFQTKNKIFLRGKIPYV